MARDVVPGAVVLTANAIIAAASSCGYYARGIVVLICCTAKKRVVGLMRLLLFVRSARGD